MQVGTATTEPPGRFIGDYELLGKLARGGMGTVYLVRRSGEASFQRLFALKLVHEHMDEEVKAVDMLLDEARIAARIHHPNVVPIVDLGAVSGRYFVVMEYVEGCSLNELLKRNRDKRPPGLVAAILIDALKGLHAAHTLRDDEDRTLGLVHRDVSPPNILVGVDGVSRITDFGVAKAEARISSTRPGMLKGKLPYLAPEQLFDDGQVDARADLFAAGVVLWNALTGRRLFHANSVAATMQNVLSRDIPPPSLVGLAPAPCFDDICLKALERDPERRFQSAAEMAKALRDAAEAADLRAESEEVANWVKTSVGAELAARRGVIRDHQPVVDTASPDSVRTLPQLLPSELADSTSTPDATLPSASVPPSAPTRFVVPLPKRSRRRSGLAVATAIALACATALAWTLVAPSKQPEPARSSWHAAAAIPSTAPPQAMSSTAVVAPLPVVPPVSRARGKTPTVRRAAPKPPTPASASPAAPPPASEPVTLDANPYKR